jgi:hypothetical protein
MSRNRMPTLNRSGRHGDPEKFCDWSGRHRSWGRQRARPRPGGPLFMPLVGAAIGEYLAQRNVRHAGKVGTATWNASYLVLPPRLEIVFAMVGIFVFALLI